MRGAAGVLLLLSVATTALEQVAASTPQFVPPPREAYSDFTALREPRVQIPVGALWVQGFGPHGSGAAADNVETIRGLSGFSVGRNLQLSLTLGLMSLLGIDPGLRNQVTARFTELSVVRVKDLSKLEGPAGEPRIYEALKAGSITVTTDNSISLNLTGNSISQAFPVEGRGVAGRSRTYSLEGRDMFIAFRIVTPSVVRSRTREMEFGQAASASARLDEYEVQVDASDLKTCIEDARDPEQLKLCYSYKPVSVTVTRPSAGDAAAKTSQLTRIKLAEASSAVIPLPLPLSDDQGGLFTDIAVDVQVKVREQDATAQRKRYLFGEGSKVTVGLQGTRLQQLKDPAGWSW